MANELARWQFATTSVYHFFFVPVTIGLAFLVAILQTAWYRTDNPDYKRMTRFFGTLLLINVAVGVVTGLVQEFEFGMNWSTYSRYVGGVFGAPLAMEGLAAFFLESTFLGLWLFGWDRLPKRVHLGTIWVVSIGTMLSAMFILVANSWMQNPVGYKLNKAGQPVLSNVWALFVNPTFMWGYAHVILASLVTGSLVMLAVSAWYLRQHQPGNALYRDAFYRTAKIALIVLIPAIAIQLSVGNKLGRGRGQVPADEDRRRGGAVEQLPAVLVLGRPDRWVQPEQREPAQDHPDPASVVGAGARAPGAVPSPGSISSRPSIRRSTGPGTTFPTSRSSTGRCGPWPTSGRSSCCWRCGAAGCWSGARCASARVFLWLSVWAVITPFLMNTAGWLLTESGRQPWIVQGLQKTVNANSPSVSSTDIWISLIALVLVYIVLGAADVTLMLRYSRRGLAQADAEAAEPSGASSAPVPSLTY